MSTQAPGPSLTAAIIDVPRSVWIAAQLWCLPQHAGKEMDAAFAGSIACALEAVRKEEREACAKLLDEHARQNHQIAINAKQDGDGDIAGVHVTMACTYHNAAEHIRNRSQ